MNNVSIRLIFDRKNVATKKRQASVQIEVTYQRRRKYIGTGIRLYSDQWGKDGKVKNHPQTIHLNKKISDQVSEIYDFLGKLNTKKIPFSFEKLDEFVNNGKLDTEESFLTFMKTRIEERGVSENTKVRQRCTLKALKEFGKIKSFSDVNLQHLKEYDDFARSKCKKQASVYNYHKNLKIFVKEAYEFQLIPENPYQHFKVEKGDEMGRKFLLKEELEAIEAVEIENESLQRVRDMFLFCCYTGLSYSDLAQFDFNKTVFSGGMYRIRDYRIKTGAEFNISLMDKVMSILRKYSFSLPIISNQKYNLYLKVLAALCGIKKHLTSHVARHTFATTVALANGVRIEVISKMLGHTNIQTTQLYAHIYQAEVYILQNSSTILG